MYVHAVGHYHCTCYPYCTVACHLTHTAVLFVQAKGVVADALLLMMKSGCLAADNQSVNSLATSRYLNTVSAVGNGLFLQMMPPQQFVQALCAKVIYSCPQQYLPPFHLSPPASTSTLTLCRTSLAPLPHTLSSPSYPPLLLTPSHPPHTLPSPPTQPTILSTHIHHVREIIPQCDASLLVQLAKVLDPSQSTIKPLLLKAMAHPKPRSAGRT